MRQRRPAGQRYEMLGGVDVAEFVAKRHRGESDVGGAPKQRDPERKKQAQAIEASRGRRGEDRAVRSIHKRDADWDGKQGCRNAFVEFPVALVAEAADVGQLQSVVGRPDLDPRLRRGRYAWRMSETPALSKAAEISSSLCRECGLCCDGSLFERVFLGEEDDAKRLSELLPLRADGDRMFFLQPCAAWRGSCCAIYADRPGVCRRFRCELLKGVESGKVEPAAAIGTVAATKRYLSRVERELHAAGYCGEETERRAAWTRFRGDFAQALTEKDTVFLQRHRELVLHWQKARASLRQNFYRKSDEAVGAAKVSTDQPVT